MSETVAVQHGFAENEGLRLHFVRFGGSGRPVVALHGVTGNAWDWHHVAQRLRPAARVVAMDLRGHGDSQWSRTGAYQTSDHAGDVIALLDQLRAGPVDLMGYSWGALIAVAVAARNPRRIRQLVIVDVEPAFEQDDTDVTPMARSFRDASEAEETSRAANPHAPGDLIPIVAAGATRPGADGLLIPKHDPFFFERWPFRRDDHWAELAELAMPSLLVHAGASFVRGEVMARMAECIPQSSLASLPDTTHVVPVDNPGGLARHVADFLAPC